MKWISVKDKLPEINEQVLCYYAISQNEYYCVGSIDCINTSQYEKGKITMSVEWRDDSNEVITPEMWARFPRVKAK